MKILTFDIGGANTKKMLINFGNRADGDRTQIQKDEIHYFPAWKKKAEFESFLKGLNEKADFIGITMTAELSDVFRNKMEGIDFLLSCCETVFDRPLYLSVDKEVLRFDEIKNPLKLAAANFAASIYYLETEYSQGILLDIGSTTTDIIPFIKGEKLYENTDLQRLKKGQMVYTGFLRTPLSSIVKKVPINGHPVGISSEYFAITADIYNILGLLEDYTCETPDGRGRSIRDSYARVSRVVCADLGEITEQELVTICEHIKDRQISDIKENLEKVSSEFGIKDIYVCGTGAVLGKEACNRSGLVYHRVACRNLPCLGLSCMVRDNVCR